MPIVNAVYSGEVLVINNRVVVLLMKIVLVVSIKMWI